MSKFILLFYLSIFCFSLFVPTIIRAQISWKEILPWELADSEFNYRAISFSNTKNCTMIGELTDTSKSQSSIILQRSTDGGLTWTRQQSGIPNFRSIVDNAHLEKVYSIDSLNVVAVGDSGLIIRTTNGGSTWIRQGTKKNIKLRDICFSDSSNGIAVGDYGTVCITNDGGKTWNIHEGLTNSYFHLTKAFKNGCYYVLGFYNKNLFRTFDGGKTWDSLLIVNPSLTDTRWTFINDIHFFDSLHAIAVGGHENSNGYNFYSIKTTDGGNSWAQVMDTNYVLAELRSISFADSLFGVASSIYGEVILTKDGGNTWTLNIIDNQHLYVNNIYFYDKRHMLAIYNRGFASALMYGTLEDAQVSTINQSSSDQLINYPNPFSLSSIVVYSLINESTVHCFVQDILGREVQHLDLGRQSVGDHTFTINASQLPAGSYYYTIEAEGKRMTKQMIVIR